MATPKLHDAEVLLRSRFTTGSQGVARKGLVRVFDALNSNHKENQMKNPVTKCVAFLPLLLCVSAPASADSTNRCGAELLKGQYVLTATGFTRAVNSVPGTPWAPKAILEILQFNGDGSLTTPAVTVANPFGDVGNILHPPAGAPGAYIVNDDCTGTVHFFDATGVMFNIYVEPPRGDTIWMIQSNPANNVFQGTAKRVL